MNYVDVSKWVWNLLGKWWTPVLIGLSGSIFLGAGALFLVCIVSLSVLPIMYSKGPELFTTFWPEHLKNWWKVRPWNQKSTINEEGYTYHSGRDQDEL